MSHNKYPQLIIQPEQFERNNADEWILSQSIQPKTNDAERCRCELRDSSVQRCLSERELGSGAESRTFQFRTFILIDYGKALIIVEKNAAKIVRLRICEIHRSAKIEQHEIISRAALENKLKVNKTNG